MNRFVLKIEYAKTINTEIKSVLIRSPILFAVAFSKCVAEPDTLTNSIRLRVWKNGPFRGPRIPKIPWRSMLIMVDSFRKV